MLGELWTEARTERLKALWAEGLSASQVAAELGGFEHTRDRGRSAVIGKVHRLGLTGRRVVTRLKAKAASVGNLAVRAERATISRRTLRYAKAPRDTRSKEQRMADGRAAALAMEARLIEETAADLTPEQRARTVPFMGLTPRTCRWPYGDPTKDDFCFCGDAPAPDKPYCAAHCRMAYLRPEARA